MKNSSSKTTRASINSKLRLFFTGFTMGLADLIPGVSGGTIAFLFGIYDELLYTIKLMTGKIPKLILAREIKSAFQLIPVSFLLPLGSGIVLAIFGLVKVVDYLLDSQPVFVWSLFFGLVLGSAYVVSGRVTTWTNRRIALILLGFGLTFIVVGLPSIGGSTNPFSLFLTGAIAITAMILPGISGSLIMVLLGQYEIIIEAVSNREFNILVVFAAGAIVGLALFVRLLTWLLKHYHYAVVAVLVGIMLGSLRRIWPWQVVESGDVTRNVLPQISPSLVWPISLFVIGFVIVILLERIGVAKEHIDIDTKEFKKEYTEIEGI